MICIFALKQSSFECGMCKFSLRLYPFSLHSLTHFHKKPPNETSSQPPPQQPQQLPVASNYVAPPPPAATTTAAANIDFDQCSKLCKYAMSALQYEDVDAAVTNLTQALGMLQKR